MNPILSQLHTADYRLNPPAHEAAISACEAQFSTAFDPLWREFFLAANGAECSETDEDGNQWQETWLSLEAIADMRQALIHFLVEHFGEDWQQREIDEAANGSIANTLLHPLWLPFFHNHTGQIYCLDHSQSPACVISLYPDTEDGDYQVLRVADNLGQWLENYYTDPQGLDNHNVLGMVEELMDEYGLLDQQGEFQQAQREYNFYDNIGLTVHSDEDIQELLETLSDTAMQHTPTANGSYYRYYDSASGIALWLCLNPDNQITEILPDFIGQSRNIVNAYAYQTEANNPLLGNCYAWAQENAAEAAKNLAADSEEEGLYPFLFSVMGFLHAQSILPLEQAATAELQLTAFARNITCYANEAEFEAAQAEQETQFATQSFIPTGLFTNEEHENSAPLALFCGEILQIKRQQNPLSGEYFVSLLVQTHGMQIDVVAHPDYFNQAPQNGGIVQIEALLQGRWINAHV